MPASSLLERMLSITVLALFQRLDLLQGLLILSHAPIIEQLLLVHCRPLDHKPESPGRQASGKYRKGGDVHQGESSP